MELFANYLSVLAGFVLGLIFFAGLCLIVLAMAIHTEARKNLRNKK